MSDITEVKIPDIGGADGVDVIEVFVKPGDTIAVEDSLLTLEGDKATMEVPSPVAGTVAEVKISVGDKVSEGDLILIVKPAESAGSDNNAADVNTSAQTPSDKDDSAKEQPKASSGQQSTDVTVPDIGGAENVDVIEVFVKPGDDIQIDDPLITLEGDKATMEVPSTVAGTVTAVKINVGDKVSVGSLIVTVASEQSAKVAAPSEPADKKSAPAAATEKVKTPVSDTTANNKLHAGPAVRRLAHELDLDLKSIPATGPKGRITKDDIVKFVKSSMKSGGGIAAGLPAMPQVDFSKFGEVSTEALSKIQKISGPFLHRNWVNIPHITQTIDADITALEAFRQEQKEFAKQQGIRLTPLVFIMKVVVAALKQFPKFNSSLAPNGEEIIVKKYYHLGIAVDTPNGLVVPVIRDVDKKGMFELAQELADISTKARDKGLTMSEMSGGCFSISSLGGIGGGYFTPIINAPEVAILGVSRSSMQPVYQADSGEFIPRLMLPLSLSYDHRVIDGAEGARFITYLAQRLADIRTLLL